MEKYIIIFLILATIYYIQTQLKSIEDFAINTLVKIAKNLMIDELQISTTSDIVVPNKQSLVSEEQSVEVVVVPNNKQSIKDVLNVEDNKTVLNKQSINVKSNVVIVEPLKIDGAKLNWLICC